MIKKPKLVEEHTDLHGGSGKVFIERNVNKDDNIEGLTMFASVTVEVGASIGYHLHMKDAEGYFITAGEGTFIDDGKIEKPVKKGDLCFISKGQGHGIVNSGIEPLQFVAIVIP